MSTLKFQQIAIKGKTNKFKEVGIIQEFGALYCQLATPVLKYNQDKEKEYKVSGVVQPGVAKQFERKFKKNKVQYVPYENFEEMYKVSPEVYEDVFDFAYTTPTRCASTKALSDERIDQYLELMEPGGEYEDGVPCFCIIPLRSSATMTQDFPAANLKKDDLIPYGWESRPKIIMDTDGKKNKDVTMTVEVGNGSLGMVSLICRVVRGEYFPRLEALKIVDLVEYVSESNQTITTAFGDISDVNPGEESEEVEVADAQEVDYEGDFEEEEVAPKPKPKPKPKAPVRRKPVEKPVEEPVEEDEDDYEDDMPFEAEEEVKPTPKPKPKPKAPVKRKAPAKKAPEPEPEEDDDFDFDEDSDEDLDAFGF